VPCTGGDNEPSSTVYVGNLSYHTTKETLMEEFPGCVSVNIPTDRETGRPRGCVNSSLLWFELINFTFL